ncbi:MAG: SIMPL domain-containing protein [Thermonemataceae bacterium]
MKSLVTVLFVCLLIHPLLAQVSGNVNYQSSVQYTDRNIDVPFPANTYLSVSVKGLANLKADTYVAIFSVNQVGKSAEEATRLIDERINEALTPIQTKTGVATYVDMISFVPMYDYEVEKKVFSKKTYNEVPTGFELKKNIHIQYTDPALLKTIIATLANSEIYDLVRVDYFSNELEATKKTLMNKAKTLLQEKLKNHETLLSVRLDTVRKQLVDGYKVVLPVEMYRSYNAYNSSSLNLKKAANVNTADKNTTLYYQPVVDKEFDFVINPTILEPVIQVLYEVKLRVVKDVSRQSAGKEYLLVTPNGDLKNLNVD